MLARQPVPGKVAGQIDVLPNHPRQCMEISSLCPEVGLGRDSGGSSVSAHAYVTACKNLTVGRGHQKLGSGTLNQRLHTFAKEKGFTHEGSPASSSTV